jgi:ADP-ribose pyrophosphatase YjhB (NUDIX family)
VVWIGEHVWVRHDDGTEAPYDEDELRPEPAERLCVVGFVTNAAREVLLVRNRKRGWELPGGGVRDGELPSVAACREIEEETGIRITLAEDEPTEIRGTPKHGASYTSRIIVFRASGEGEPKPGSDAAEAAWYSASEALGLLWRGRLSDLASREVLLTWARRGGL